MSLAAAFSDVIETEMTKNHARKLPGVLNWSVPRSASLQATEVTLIEERNEWHLNALKRLARFASLDQNWDECGADAPADVAIRVARYILARLSSWNFEPSSVDPSAEGGICISFRNERRYGDVECFNSGEILAVTSFGGDKTKVWEVPNDEEGLDAAVGSLRTFLCR